MTRVLVRLGLAPLGLVLALAGCADVVDTELGLDAVVEDAEITVSGSDVSGSFNVSYRVGGFAEGDRFFAVQGIDLIAGGAGVTTFVPMAPADFEPMISPGESRSVILTGDAAVADPSVLCGATVTILLRYTDRSTGELAMHQSTTENVTCL